MYSQLIATLNNKRHIAKRVLKEVGNYCSDCKILQYLRIIEYRVCDRIIKNKYDN